MLMAGPDQAQSLSSLGDVDVDLSRFVLPELLLSVFDWLPQKDLFSAAAVCHRWRALVLAHPNLFYHLALVFDLERDNMREWVPVHQFCAGLRYLRERNLRASVAVDGTKIMRTVEWTHQARTTQLQVSQPTASSMAVMSAIRDALPILTRLELAFGPVHGAILEKSFLSHLCGAAAPQLQTFSIKLNGFPAQRAVLPERLFAGHAPKLWNCSVYGIKVDRPVPALFATTVVVVIMLARSSTVHLTDHFPRVRRLAIGHTNLPMLYSLPKTLRELEFVVYNDVPDLSELLRPLAAVPHVVMTLFARESPSTVDHRSFVSLFGDLKQFTESLYMQLLDKGDPGVTVLTIHNNVVLNKSSFVRTVLFRRYTDDAFRAVLVANLRPLAAHLLDVAVDEHLFDLLPRVFESLPSTRRLHVYWHPPRSTQMPRVHAGDKRMYCPKLRQLHLAALMTSGPPVEVNAERLQRAIRPGSFSVLQQFTRVQLNRLLVQIPGNGDFTVMDSDEGRRAYIDYDEDCNLVAVMYQVGLEREVDNDLLKGYLARP
ncbi:hypothetical protein EXIGLDRAFT_731882 [Exidia glandulosa HHB12029]|uniref:F-box domain-containing protein n=1 Tax=Exidia glandulosa HHB12029 TaxID=1314781 RepID=A0A165BQN0_EXIGL|nr:hypothetical protein EXIGLDRAFT_731882 [Exidia glandulosa HHB12029]